VLTKGHDAWREEQKAGFRGGTKPSPYPEISDDEIRDTIESNQLRLIKERGADLTLFSPRAWAMAPHVGDGGPAAVISWPRLNRRGHSLLDASVAHLRVGQSFIAAGCVIGEEDGQARLGKACYRGPDQNSNLSERQDRLRFRVLIRV